MFKEIYPSEFVHVMRQRAKHHYMVYHNMFWPLIVLLEK